MSLSLPQIMQEIMDNDIHIYNGEIDEDEELPEVKELRVRAIPMQHVV